MGSNHVTQLEKSPITGASSDTVVVIIPFRDREGHLDKFKTYWRWFAAEGMKPHTVKRWVIYIVEQFDTMPFNRGWTFNVGFAAVTGLKFASADIDVAKAFPFSCAVIQDIDYLPEAGVDYADCAVPVQLSSEIDRYGGKVPYLQSAGGIVGMSAAHWRQINGFGNEYFGWGGEDDELHHRLRINGLLKGDCYPFCKPHDINKGKTGVSIKRPKPGHGRFSGKYMHSENHTKRIADSGAYLRNVKMLAEIERGAPRWKGDGLSNLAFHIVSEQEDTSEADSHGITYRHIKVRRGSAAFELARLPLATPKSLCGGGSGDWVVEDLGTDLPWTPQDLRARAFVQASPQLGGACASPASLVSFILVDRRRNLAKVLQPLDNEDETRMLVTFYRSLSTPSDDGLIIAVPLSPAQIKSSFEAHRLFFDPPAPYSLCRSKIKGGFFKYSVHSGTICGGGGWELIPGGTFKAYSAPRVGLKPVSWCDNTKHWVQRIVQAKTCPKRWADLEWQQGGALYASSGNAYCVGTSSPAGRAEGSAFSRALPKARCEGYGFNHEFSFQGVVEDKQTLRRVPLSITICRHSSGAAKVSTDHAACAAEGWRLLARFAARDAAAATQRDIVVCVRRVGDTGDMFAEAAECSGDAGWKLKFAVPRLAAAAKIARTRVCWGRSAVSGFAALGVGSAECGAGGVPSSTFEVPSVTDVAGSTPLLDGAASASSQPLYALVEEDQTCFGFLCPSTLVSS